MDLPNPFRYTARLPQRRLWFGTVAAAVAWALHGFICFLITTQVCPTGNGNAGGGTRLLLAAITLLFLGIAVAGGTISFRNWRAVYGPRSLTHAEALNREAFMSLVGVFLSVAFVLGIIWAGIPLILIDVCAYAR